MGVVGIIILIVVIAILIFFLYYPYPLIWLSKRAFNKGSFDSLDGSAVVLTTLHYESEKGGHVFNGNIYEFMYDGAVPTGKNIIVWFHGGGFIDGQVRGKPTAFDALLSKGIRVIQFDYPTIFAFSQSDAFAYVAAVVEWLFTEGPCAAKDNVTWFGGDSAGALMSTLLPNNILNDDKSWGDLSALKNKLRSPTVVWNISGFYPNVSNPFIRHIWNWYIQRGSKIRYDNKPPAIHPDLRVVNFTGTKDILSQDAKDLVKANGKTCMGYEYTNKDHEFPFIDVQDANSVDVFRIISNYITGTANPDTPTIGVNVLPDVKPQPQPQPQPQPDQ